jgi:hypothetical protein
MCDNSIWAYSERKWEMDSQLRMTRISFSYFLGQYAETYLLEFEVLCLRLNSILEYPVAKYLNR